MKDYTQKIVYIGIDVHKKSYAITAICNKEIVKRDRLKASPEILVNYIKKYFNGGRIYTAYEAGFSGYYLHRYLVRNGIENIVVNPASIKVSARERVKTDKRDSLKIAKQLSNRELKGINIPSEERENFRTITRTRDKIAEAKKSIGNQLKSLLLLQNLTKADDDRKISSKWVSELQNLKVAEEIKYCINMFAKIWLELDDKLKELLKKLEAQSKKDSKIDLVYRAAPGIGALSARILANELEDMRQFSNEKKLFSYTGLTPSEHSSGENKRLGSISRQGKPILRKILVQAAWVAIRHDRRLAIVYERISKKAGAKKAIVAVARKLIGYIRACFVNGELYKDKYANAPGSNRLGKDLVEAC